jgi:hypothetical protein
VYGNPEVRILEPADGAVFTSGETATLVGEGHVPHWGPLDGGSLEWESDLAGPLGTGEVLAVDGLPVGVHGITLTGTHVSPTPGTASITIEVRGGSPPEVEILAPRDGYIVYVDEPHGARGAAEDPEDGPLMGDALSWESDLEGFLGTGEHLTGFSLAVGEHTLTLRATDSDGLSAEASVTLIVSDDPMEVILAAVDELEQAIDALRQAGELSPTFAQTWGSNLVLLLRSLLMADLSGQQSVQWRCGQALHVRDWGKALERATESPSPNYYATSTAADVLGPLLDRLDALLLECVNPNG